MGTPLKMASSIAGKPSLVPGILMKRLGAGRRGMQRLRRRDGLPRVVSKQRRHFQRDPAVDSGRAVVDRPEQVRRPLQIGDRQFEEQILA